MRYALILVALGGCAAWGCGEEPTSIGQNLPVEVRYVNIHPSVLTNFSTLIANGKNYIEFTVELLDQDHHQLITGDHAFKLLVDGSQEMGYPHHFSTTIPGHHTISVKGIPEAALVTKQINVVAQEEPVLEPVTLPIVFHYVKDDTLDWVPNERESIQDQIANALKGANDAYANLDGSSDPNATNAHITFTLADQDPEGNLLQFPGIDFVKATGSPYYRIEAIDSLIWDGNFWKPTDYVNVWVFTLGSGWNWSYFPEYVPSPSGYPADPYGVVMNKSAVQLETVLAHELGHYLDLRHVFDIECSDPDFCDDTWSYKRNEFLSAWKLIRTACTGDAFTATNRMDYFDTENNTFTLQQVKRMRFALENCPFVPSDKNSNSGGRRKGARSSLQSMKPPDPARRVIN